MRYIKEYKIFEFNYYQSIIDRINSTHTDCKIIHRDNDPVLGRIGDGSPFYDIYYYLTTENKWIFIGVYNHLTTQLKLFVSKSLSDYNEKGAPDLAKAFIIPGELDEFNFDLLLNKWYDIYDKL